jgi:hypothetical protein
MKEAFDLIKERLEAKGKETSRRWIQNECDDKEFSFFVGMVEGLLLARKIVSEVEAEYGNGWITVEKALPKERDWYLAMFKEPDTGFMGLPFIADYLMGEHTNHTTDDGWIIAECTDNDREDVDYYKRLKCVAWMPLPAPYKGV